MRLENDLDFWVCPRASPSDKRNIQIPVLWVSHLHCGRRCQSASIICVLDAAMLLLSSAGILQLHTFKPFLTFDSHTECVSGNIVLGFDFHKKSKLHSSPFKFRLRFIHSSFPIVNTICLHQTIDQKWLFRDTWGSIHYVVGFHSCYQEERHRWHTISNC